MAILSDIISALGRMGAALFQQLGDELLTAIYKPINIESRGTKRDKLKHAKAVLILSFQRAAGKY